MNLYLTSTDSTDFYITRKVLHFKKIFIDVERVVLVIDVDVPIIGQKFGWLDKDIYTFYLLDRYKDKHLALLYKFPINVFVLIPKNVEEKKFNTISQFLNIAWACLYDDYDDAKNHKY